MIASMTGFGRGVVEHQGFRATIELSSVNNRFLDISFRMPRGMAEWESALRDLLREKLQRGKVVCSVTWERTQEAESTIALNRSSARRYKEIIDELQRDYGIAVSTDPIGFLQLPEVLTIEKTADDEATGAVLREAAAAALDSLVAMRQAEGQKIVSDLLERTRVIHSLASDAKAKASDHPALIRDKLQQRIAEVFGEAGYDPQRLAEEVAYYAEKADITEECVRLDIHLDHLEKSLNGAGEVGRRLNFLLQEINREVNTIGSKAPDVEIAALVVSMKEETEKIREQVQNLE